NNRVGLKLPGKVLTFLSTRSAATDLRMARPIQMAPRASKASWVRTRGEAVLSTVTFQPAEERFRWAKGAITELAALRVVWQAVVARRLWAAVVQQTVALEVAAQQLVEEVVQQVAVAPQVEAVDQIRIVRRSRGEQCPRCSQGAI